MISRPPSAGGKKTDLRRGRIGIQRASTNETSLAEQELLLSEGQREDAPITGKDSSPVAAQAR